jgi:DNA modification methylase
MLKTILTAEADLTAHYRKRLVVNPDLDRKLVSFQANKQEAESRWFKYREGFSAALIRYILQRTGLSEGHLLDPFAGSGTTLFVAREQGMDADGIELLPSSIAIIRIRQQLLEAHRPHLAQAVRAFRHAASWERPGRVEPFSHLNITAGAFPPETEQALGRYLYDTQQVSDETLRLLLRFAALCILESISYTRKDGQYLRWDARSGRKTGNQRFDKGYIPSFREAIQEKLDEISFDLTSQDTPTLFGISSAIRPGHLQLHEGTCLEILPGFSPQVFDGLITSPPYCNRYDYTRTYALELALCGTDEANLRQLRQTMLSCTVENREKTHLSHYYPATSFTHAQQVWQQQEMLGLILDYLESCRVEGTLNNTGIPRMVRNYFAEMALLLLEASRVLKPGAPFVMVNDNVRYQGIHVPVDLILSDMAEQAGFEVEKIWVLPQGKGNSSQQMGRHGRAEVRKCVYVWRRTTAHPAMEGPPASQPAPSLAEAA